MTSNRERFEEWYLKEFWEGSNGGRAMLKKEPCGGYTYAKPQELWKVWQAAQPAAGEPIAWMHEDELPERYPYDAMFPFSKVDFARMFPVFGPPAAAHGDEAPGTVRVTADWLKKVHRDLDACQKVIWLAGCRPRVPGGFDPAYCEDAQARLKEIDEHIARAQAAGGAQHA